MDFTQNYFELLGVPQQYVIDQLVLSDRYRDLQKQFHPDKCAAKPASEQRAAVQFAAYINTAYQTLKLPVSRAEYLLELVDHSVDQQSTTISDGQFLMLQMEWREDLSDIAGVTDLSVAENKIDSLRVVVKQESVALQQLFYQQYKDLQFDVAKNTVAKLHFVEKMLREIESLEASLFD